MRKTEDKKRKGYSEELPIKKSEEEVFDQRKRAAYSAMGKLGGLARAKQLAEKGFSAESKPQQISKTITTQQRRKAMNIDIIKGQWHVIKGKLKEQWGKLTDDEIIEMEGSSEELAGVLQKVYGYEKDEAHKEIKKFIDKNNWKDE